MDDNDISLPPVTFHRMVDQVAMAGIVPWWRSEFGVTDDHPRGKGILVGVVDTGIDELHAKAGALANAVKVARDFTHSPSGWKDVRAGHGTHVAGIIAARGSLWSPAPEAELCVAKALGDDGSGRSSWVAAGIRFCVDEGCQLVNCSLGSAVKDDGIEAALEYADLHGVIVVGASGNDGAVGVSSPADSDFCLAIGAVDRLRGIAPFSNRGTEVDCVGPGVKILSAYLGGKFAELSGTSMSTPFCTSLFACMLSHQKANGWPMTRGAKGAMAVLERVCDDLGTKGKDIQFGNGVPVPSRMYEPPPPIVVIPPIDPADPSLVVSVTYGDRVWAGSIPVVKP